MAISFNEFLSQAHSGDYRNGLGKKVVRPSAQTYFPCMACNKARPTDALPCPHCRRNAGWAKCGGVMLSGLGSTTVIQGQADLEPGDWGYQYVQTTKPNTTVVGRAVGRPPVDRRINITRMVSELEYLAGTPGIHPRVLAQKVWQARKALMGSGKWSWANYQNPRSSYDSYDDLVSRLEAVEAVLGVDKMSPKLMSQLYGMSGGLGGLGDYGYTGAYRGAPWGAVGGDPIKKLANCIRGALCMPKSFCCPPGTSFEDPYYDEFPEFEEFPEFFSAAAGGGGGGGGNGTWIGGEPPAIKIGDDWPLTQPKKPAIKIGQDWPLTQPRKPAVKVGEDVTITKKPAVKVGEDVTITKKPAVTTGKTGTSPKPVPKQATTVGTPVSWYQPPTTQQPPQPGLKVAPHLQNVYGRQARSGIATGGTPWAPGTAVALQGLGARHRSPNLSHLIAQLRAARRQIGRGR